MRALFTRTLLACLIVTAAVASSLVIANTVRMKAQNEPASPTPTLDHMVFAPTPAPTGLPDVVITPTRAPTTPTPTGLPDVVITPTAAPTGLPDVSAHPSSNQQIGGQETTPKASGSPIHATQEPTLSSTLSSSSSSLSLPPASSPPSPSNISATSVAVLSSVAVGVIVAAAIILRHKL
jgi:hypothetical protein